MASRLAVDIGGTFTDIALETGGKRFTTKVLTTPNKPETGVMAAIEIVLSQAGTQGADIDLVIHGTTLATNALIERKGALTALITTQGHRDTLETAFEDRFSEYDLNIDKPEPLVPRPLRFTVPERMNARGKVLLALDEAAVEALVPELARLGVASVAVGLLHSYANPAHERRIRELLQARLPELWITLSSEVCPEVREYERLSTACANAYVQPLMAGYLGRLDGLLRLTGFRCPLFLMLSGGGLATLNTAMRFPIRLVESGPAGGAILAGFIAAECGLPKVLSFDMGGTTAKICLIDEYRPQGSRSFEVARIYRSLKGSGLPLRIPVIEMVEIGAGGGSLAEIDALRRIKVGPESAGSEPGPACYGRGGVMPTVTDADVVLGRIDPDLFAGGTLKLDAVAANAAVTRMIGGPLALDGPVAAFGISEIVEENMANAARVHAIERGKTLSDCTMVAFGGAAPVHAARLAQKIGIDRIIVPTSAGVGSAIGFLRAPIAYEVVRSLYMRLEAFDLALVNRTLGEMRAEAEAVVRQGAPAGAIAETCTAEMRYLGQGHEITVPVSLGLLTKDSVAAIRASFEAKYGEQFGRAIGGVPIELLAWSVVVRSDVATPVRQKAVELRPAPAPHEHRLLFDAECEAYREVPVYRRATLAPGMTIAGPAVIAEAETSTVVVDGFDAHLNALDYIVLERQRPAEGTSS
ncbi:MAG TPA: hydantoinase/oxoprolinase family protein [Candidatus Cybelea sp.]|nr:hydantoinase/oxoprolinase family protein [Candidatus Cybelea sp.]